MVNQRIKLSDNIIVPCPEVGFALRKVSKCSECEHFRGLSQATVGDKPLDSGHADDYQVICGRPITRRLQEIIED